MALIMGIDTGGTYTDGAIVDPVSKRVLCKSKVFTKKHDLLSSIRDCMDQLALCETEKISMVCISTTLATNAIVEGRRGSVGILLIGDETEKQFPADICIRLQGKLDIKGREIESIDRNEVLEAIGCLKNQVDAVAISGYASVRNPSHELQVKEIVREKLRLPVISAHELTSQLGYYERTVTVALNAGLIPMIGELVNAVKEVLKSRSMDVPIMVVKGDGSLMSESFAIEKPIETILSGPAASITGAVFLTGHKNAVILDMGGTTTDIAKVSEGRVKNRKNGATVGGWSPRIQAADICTFGIGGDSRIQITPEGELSIGPQKVQPLCVAGSQYPNLIHELASIRDNIEHGPEPKETDCLVLLKITEGVKLSKLEKGIINILRDGAHSLLFVAKALNKRPEALNPGRLEKENIIQRIALTPTDILHAAGKYHQWDETVSLIVTEIFAQKMGKTVLDFLKTAESCMTNQLINVCRESISDMEGSRLIAIGAPVDAWLPAVSEQLQTTLIIPEHAEVANAIGAAVGRIIETVDVLIRPGREHIGYILHAPWEYRSFSTLEEAVAYTIPAAGRYVRELAERAGGDRVDISESLENRYTNDDTADTKAFIETRIHVTAIGYPKWMPFQSM